MYNLVYFFAIIILCSGLFLMLSSDNYIKKIIGLCVFQNSVLIFYVGLGKIDIGIAPIEKCAIGEVCKYVYSAPLPHVLMLTAIVVGFSTLSVGLALIYRIFKEFGSLSESEINLKEYK